MRRRFEAAMLSRRDVLVAAGGLTVSLQALRAIEPALAQPSSDGNAPMTTEASDIRLKSIYLAKRKPGFSHDEFVIRWRKHGALAMSQSFFYNRMKLYVQAEIITPEPWAGAAKDYDAVAYLIQRPGGELTSDELSELAFMVTDEYETFAGPILPVLLQTEETVLKDGPPGGVTAFLFFSDIEKAAQVAAHYRSSPQARRISLNTRRDDLTYGDMSSLVPYKAVVDISAASLGELTKLMGVSEVEAWRSADLVTVTRECVLWDRLGERAL